MNQRATKLQFHATIELLYLTICRYESENKGQHTDTEHVTMYQGPGFEVNQAVLEKQFLRRLRWETWERLRQCGNQYDSNDGSRTICCLFLATELV